MSAAPSQKPAAGRSNWILAGLVLLTTVVATLTMFYMGAAGVWSSTRFSSSWRSLLATMGIGYVGGLILWLITTPITFIGRP